MSVRDPKRDSEKTLFTDPVYLVFNGVSMLMSVFIWSWKTFPWGYSVWLKTRKQYKSRHDRHRTSVGWIVHTACELRPSWTTVRTTVPAIVWYKKNMVRLRVICFFIHQSYKFQLTFVLFLSITLCDVIRENRTSTFETFRAIHREKILFMDNSLHIRVRLHNLPNNFG